MLLSSWPRQKSFDNRILCEEYWVLNFPRNQKRGSRTKPAWEIVLDGSRVREMGREGRRMFSAQVTGPHPWDSQRSNWVIPWGAATLPSKDIRAHFSLLSWHGNVQSQASKSLSFVMVTSCVTMTMLSFKCLSDFHSEKSAIAPGHRAWNQTLWFQWGTCFKDSSLSSVSEEGHGTSILQE